MKKFAVSLLIVLGLLAGCAAQTMWVKDGASASDFERDKNQCVDEGNVTARMQYGAIAQGLRDGWSIAGRQNDLAVICMRAKGWTEVPKPGVSP